MRRLPVYILLDTSGSMRGEPIEAVRVGLESLLSSLRKDPYALETVWMSIMTFDREARIILPMTELSDVRLPEIPVPKTSPTNMGEALELLYTVYRRDIQLSTSNEKGDWLPILVLMTDGAPSDIQLFNEMVRQIGTYRFAKILCCAAGMNAKTEFLKKISPDVFSLDTMNSQTFSKFWQWVSTALERQSCRTDMLLAEIPPPPPEIQIVR